MSDTKTCIKCYETKPLSEFYKDNSTKDGHRNDCTVCRKAFMKAYLKTEKGKSALAKAQAKYKQSDKGKAAEARYAKTDKSKARLAKYAKSDKGKARLARYAKSDKGKAARKARNHRRRAKMKNNGGTLTAQQIQELQSTPDKECFWCETECNENYHLDHIVPISKGGRNSLCNIAISCQPCNNKKGSKDLTEWLEEIGWFDSKRSSES